MSEDRGREKTSKELRKRMFDDYFNQLCSAGEDGKKVVYTFVPGNLTELMLSFDFIPVYPEINALQSALRGESKAYINRAETHGHSEDVCTYVKCDVGMMLSGNIGPMGKPLPPPDLLLLSYTGCFTFMKWFENLKALYNCPVVMLHVPYQADGVISDTMVNYVADQLREVVIPVMEKVAGKKYDPDRVRRLCSIAAKAEDLFVSCLETARNVPSPIDGYFGGVFEIFPIFSAFRGTSMAVDYYEKLLEEIRLRVEQKLGSATLEGNMGKEEYRLVVEGTPNWTHFWELWKLFYRRKAVVVASSYTRVGGLYDFGFRHDPEAPLESFARYCMGCYTNLSLPQRVELLSRYVRDYRADGLIVHSVKSCNSFSAGQLLLSQEVEKRTGVPCGFIESDLVDARYFSPAQIKNRLDAYFQMIDEKRKHHGRRIGR